ncbi:MAG TPA: aminotransferase class I/II-fold pyridoxal phosphate-dependent enzyme [Pyrinomonadaceae bacterium]|nr:aminotransferase class I/II-fold pyridoxal phosphate-dependent enzyme [Pyrinomonadaceae bacterium]
MEQTSDSEGAAERPELGDVPEEEFRAALHRVADWIADYRAGLEELNISPRVEPGEITSQLLDAPPEEPAAFEEIFRDFQEQIVPGLVHWGHPKFLGYFGSTTTAHGILGEMLAAALNVSAMTWRTSPAATELEETVLDWLRRMLRLPEAFTGVVYDTASVAVLHALAAARESIGIDARALGLSGRPEVPALRIYASEQAHSSVEKAAITLGLGERNVRRVACDDAYRLDVSALRRAVGEDSKEGFRPLAVVATVGTTSTTSVDPVREIASVCREHGLWLHVDAAYGGALALLPEGRHVFEGVEEADSVVVNPHKWLFVPLDFSALYVRRPELLRATFSLVPEYLRGDAAQGERNYMDYGVQLGRRFRALKAWMVFRGFGRRGIEARIREHVRLARLFASWLDADARFELLAPVTMAVVCFRAVPPESEGASAKSEEASNDFNRRLVEEVNATGRAYLTHTTLRGGRVAVRLAVGNVLTTERHLSDVYQLVKRLSSV